MQQKDEEAETFMSEITDKVKTELNAIFHIALNSLSFPLWQAAVMMTIEFIQTLYFVFYPPVRRLLSQCRPGSTGTFLTQKMPSCSS